MADGFQGFARADVVRCRKQKAKTQEEMIGELSFGFLLFYVHVSLECLPSAYGWLEERWREAAREV